MTNTALQLRFDYAVRPEEGDDVDKLHEKDALLREIERDVKRVVDELSARKKISAIRYCVDFDVIHSAFDWYDERSTDQFWASLIFFLEGVPSVILPGTLFEIFRYLSERSEPGAGSDNTSEYSSIGPIGRAFVEAFELGRVKGQTVVKQSVEAYKEYRNRNRKQYEAVFLHDLLQKSEMYDRKAFGDFDLPLFDRCVTALSEFRADKILNNRIDGLNYALCSQLNRRENKAADPKISPKWIIVSDSHSMSALHRTMSGREGRGRARECTVWNSRVAAIFALIAGTSADVLEARNTAWKLYQSLIDERRAIQFEIVRRQQENFHPPVSSAAPDTLLRLVQSFQGMQEAIAAADDRSQVLARFIDERTGHTKVDELSESIMSTIRQKIDGDDKKFYNHIMTDSKVGKFNIVARPIDPKFGYLSRIDVTAADGPYDTFLEYEDRLQLIIPTAAPLQEFIDILNRVRVRISAGIARGVYPSLERDGAETAQLVILSAAQEAIPEATNLNWRPIIYESTTEATSTTSEPEPYVLAGVMNIPRHEVSFFRFSSLYVDLSLEGALVVASVAPLVAAELEFVHERLSVFETGRVFRELRGNRRWGKHLSAA